MPNDTDKNRNDTKNNSTTQNGQLFSLFSGGLIGFIAYNAYHAVMDATQASSTAKPKK